MSISTVSLASGDGWRIQDVRCSYGPRDRPFEEQHNGISIAIVTSGSFTYRTAQGTALLAPGGVLLGNDGQCFECGHEHGAGDRCLSFRFDGEFFESIICELPGARQLAFALPHLPPLPELIPIVADAQAARRGGVEISFEELALCVVAKVGAILVALNSSSGPKRLREPSKRDRQRVTNALRRIETQCDVPLTLPQLARDAAMSPYHFLRTFRAVAGVTPHQFLLHTRLLRAATKLHSSDGKISAIALEAGFSDLSTFNRRFRQLLGASPGAYRAAGLAHRYPKDP